MKKSFFLGLLAMVLLGSCSNDNGGASPASIIGTWDAVALQLDENTATQDELLARDFLDILTAKDCYVLSVSFEASGTATVEDSFDYLDLTGLSQGNFNIPCPTQADSESGPYSYENGMLTFTDPLGVTSSVRATLSGNSLTMDLEGSVFDDVVSSGQLVFQRR